MSDVLWRKSLGFLFCTELASNFVSLLSGQVLSREETFSRLQKTNPALFAAEALISRGTADSEMEGKSAVVLTVVKLSLEFKTKHDCGMYIYFHFSSL